MLNCLKRKTIKNIELFRRLAPLSLGLLLFFLSIAASAQNVKIYVARDTTKLWNEKYRSEIYWDFYKVDFDEKTIQNKGFAFRDGDKVPDLTNMNNLFKDEPKDWYVILNSSKIKVKRVKSTHVKRVWNDFATPGRTGGSPSYLFFINNDTLFKKGGILKFVLDRELTERYKKETVN